MKMGCICNSERKKANTTLESVQKYRRSIFISCSCSIIFANLEASNAACNSKRGIVKGLTDATRLLAPIKTTHAGSSFEFSKRQ